MKLSIIIPIYNAEEYLGRCLDSLTGISCLDMEVICIDDGSKDSSWEICGRYAAKDCRVKRIRQDNAGPMAARNRGLREAAGEYICFVDSDDWIAPEMPVYLIGKMDEDPSIVICVSGAVKNYPDGSERMMFRETPERMYTGEEAWKEMLLNQVFFWYMWGKIYRASVIRGLYADESVITGEDLGFHWELFRSGRAGNVWYSPKYKYHYFANPESLTEGAEVLKRKQSDFKVYKKILGGGLEEELSGIMGMYALRTIYDILRELCFRDAGATEFMEYITEGGKLVNGLDGSSQEDVWFVDQMRKLTEDVERTRKYFLDVFMAIKKTLRSLNYMEKGKAVYIYGAGIAAGYTAVVIEDENLMDYEGYVISDGQPSMGRFRGKPVFHLSQIPQNSLLLLAMNQSNQDAVCRNLTGNWDVVRLPVPDKF